MDVWIGFIDLATGTIRLSKSPQQTWPSGLVIDTRQDFLRSQDMIQLLDDIQKAVPEGEQLMFVTLSPFSDNGKRVVGPAINLYPGGKRDAGIIFKREHVTIRQDFQPKESAALETHGLITQGVRESFEFWLRDSRPSDAHLRDHLHLIHIRRQAALPHDPALSEAQPPLESENILPPLAPMEVYSPRFHAEEAAMQRYVVPIGPVAACRGDIFLVHDRTKTLNFSNDVFNGLEQALPGTADLHGLPCVIAHHEGEGVVFVDDSKKLEAMGVDALIHHQVARYLSAYPRPRFSMDFEINLALILKPHIRNRDLSERLRTVSERIWTGARQSSGGLHLLQLACIERLTRLWNSGGSDLIAPADRSGALNAACKVFAPLGDVALANRSSPALSGSDVVFDTGLDPLIDRFVESILAPGKSLAMRYGGESLVTLGLLLQSAQDRTALVRTMFEWGLCLEPWQAADPEALAVLELYARVLTGSKPTLADWLYLVARLGDRDIRGASSGSGLSTAKALIEGKIRPTGSTVSAQDLMGARHIHPFATTLSRIATHLQSLSIPLSEFAEAEWPVAAIRSELDSAGGVGAMMTEIERVIDGLSASSSTMPDAEKRLRDELRQTSTDQDIFCFYTLKMLRTATRMQASAETFLATVEKERPLLAILLAEGGATRAILETSSGLRFTLNASNTTGSAPKGATALDQWHIPADDISSFLDLEKMMLFITEALTALSLPVPAGLSDALKADTAKFIRQAIFGRGKPGGREPESLFQLYLSRLNQSKPATSSARRSRTTTFREAEQILRRLRRYSIPDFVASLEDRRIANDLRVLNAI